MRIYVFKSGLQKRLRAFSGDLAGSKLPGQFAPWHAVGVIGPGKNPPHQLPRDQIEEAIAEHGFQLWRMKARTQPA